MELSLDRPIAGVLAPLFALRSNGDLGIGDTESLRQFIDWAASCGFGLVQLLPVNETGADNSPYNAISSTALDPTTIAISPETLPDLPARDFKAIIARFDLAALRAGPVKYRIVKPLKRALLWRAFERFGETALKKNTARARQFRAFAEEQVSWLEDYALFRVLMEENGSELWDRWPAEHASALAARMWLQAQTAERREELRRQLQFHRYVQWIAFSQWRAVKEYADRKGVALMGDVPFGVSYYSADVFAQPQFFDLKWCGGAPPEPYFKDDPFTVKWGQNWGVPLYRWDVMRRDGFAWWRQRVRTVREMFHLFRVDHVLGFYRIYAFPWRPQENGDYLHLSHDQARAKTGGELPRFQPRDDSNNENCAFNCRQGEEILRALIREVGEHRLIGEDLGMVPHYVRPSLTALGIPGFKIPQWEHTDQALTPGERYQRLSVATYATHDHEPLHALWNRWAGLVHRHGQAPEGQHALHEMHLLATFAALAARPPQAWDGEIHEGLLRGLFRSNSWIAVAMITDLFASLQRFNVPGIAADSNWSERLPETIAQWQSDPARQTQAERFAQILRETGRA